MQMKDGKLFLFSRANDSINGILMMQKINGVWSKPKLAPFSAGKHDWDFMLSQDDTTVFISSGRGRPVHKDSSSVENYRIWVSEQTKDGWSKPLLLPYPVNSGYHDSYPSLTDEGVLYFFSRRNEGFGYADIYRSTKIDGQYSKIEILDEPVNSRYSDLDPFIAPDESYLTFCSDRPGGFGSYDIYITYKKEDGTWTEIQNLGKEFNTEFYEYCPVVSPDGNYFFFNIYEKNNNYWCTTEFIEEKRKSAFGD